MSQLVYLNGGPCNGTNKTLTDAEYATQETTCKGTVYRYDPQAGVGFELPVFSSADAYGQRGGGPATIHDPQTLGGWNAIRRSVNKHLPSTLRESQAAGQRARRSLAKARRVRG